MFIIELLQVALQRRTALSRSLTEGEWGNLYEVAKKQALLGITFVAIERLPVNQRPPRAMLVKWGLAANHIQKKNEEQCRKVLRIIQMFQQDGFRGLVLKGQGIAQYYKTDNLDGYRTPGDLDLWLDGSRSEVVAYARSRKPGCAVVYHHVEFPCVDGVEVELHVTPSWMNNYFVNRALQRYFDGQKLAQFAAEYAQDELPTPSLGFNRVYILVHIYRHLFHTGIGFRQMLDYYYVLRQGFTEEERAEAMQIFASLGMERFVEATMWVLHHVFGLEEQYMLTEPNENEGRFLLSEIVLAGNFGQHDDRMMHGKAESEVSWGLRKVKRNLRFIYRYPSEVIWSPLFKVWHYCWRKQFA